MLEKYYFEFNILILILSLITGFVQCISGHPLRDLMYRLKILGNKNDITDLKIEKLHILD